MKKLMTSMLVLSAGALMLSGCSTSSVVSEPTPVAGDIAASTPLPVSETPEDTVPFTMTADERLADLTNALEQSWATDTDTNRAEACTLWTTDREGTLTILMGGANAEPIGVTVEQAREGLSTFFDSKCDSGS